MSNEAFASDIFQENKGYQHASILLYDPVKGSQQATKNILFNIGFREVQMVSDLGRFVEYLESNNYDLVFADITEQLGDVVELVAKLRRGDIGDNPFVTVALTSGEIDDDGLHRALGSGADDLIMRPLSIGGVQKRIKTMVDVRKPFVVTSDYIGPDRGCDPDQLATAQVLPVPNSLKDRVESGGRSTSKTADQIASMREKVAEEHLMRLAIQMGEEGHRLSGAKPGSDDAVASREALEKTAREVATRLGPDREQASDLAAMLLNVLSGQQKVHRTKQKDLIYQLALGVGAALRGDADEGALAAEIRSTAQAMKRRLGGDTSAPGSAPEKAKPAAR